MFRLALLIFSMIFASQAWGQEWAATIGVHQTTADSNVNGSSIDGKLNFKAGALLGFELNEQTKFRTGFLYNQRYFDVKTGGQKFKYEFSYFDVPANVQYNLNEMVGLFGGLVIAVNMSDSVEGPAGVTVGDPDAEKMMALMNLGVNLMFNDMIGFDFYYERGMGRIAEGVENFSTFGGNFIYWF